MKLWLFVLALTLTACGGDTSSTAQDPGAVPTPSEVSSTPQPADALAVGSLAPDFVLPGSDGQTHRLSDYSGQYVVLAFFPKAFTGG